MRKIKKYANRKLYDMTEKRYISLNQIAELVEAGEEVQIFDRETGADITQSVLSQILARKDPEEAVSFNILNQLFKKGGETLNSYARKYAPLWQGALTAAEDEIDKLFALLPGQQDMNEKETRKAREAVMAYVQSSKAWVGDKIDQRLGETLRAMNLVTADDVEKLNEKIDALTAKIAAMENEKTASGK